MIEMTIPGRGVLKLEHLVCDVEGTLTLDGRFRDELFKPLIGLRDRLDVHLITPDVYGWQDEIDHRLGLRAVRIQTTEDVPGAEQKRAFVERLGAQRVIAIGQGADDARMLAAAALGICVFSPEGVSPAALMAADLVVADTLTALHLLTYPLRIVNTLRM